MNSAVKLALAGAMSIASVSGVALAQTADPMVDTTATTNSTTMTSESVSIVASTASTTTRTARSTRALSSWPTIRNR